MLLVSLWCVVLVARAAQGDTDRASSSAKLVHNPLAPLSIFQGFIWKPSNIVHSKYNITLTHHTVIEAAAGSKLPAIAIPPTNHGVVLSHVEYHKSISASLYPQANRHATPVFPPPEIGNKTARPLWSRGLLVSHWCVVLVARRRSAVPGVLSEVPRVSQRGCWRRLWLA